MRHRGKQRPRKDEGRDKTKGIGRERVTDKERGRSEARETKRKGRDRDSL